MLPVRSKHTSRCYWLQRRSPPAKLISSSPLKRNKNSFGLKRCNWLKGKGDSFKVRGAFKTETALLTYKRYINLLVLLVKGLNGSHYFGNQLHGKRKSGFSLVKESYIRDPNFIRSKMDVIHATVLARVPLKKLVYPFLKIERKINYSIWDC